MDQNEILQRISAAQKAIGQKFTPGQKAIQVNKQFGNNSISGQQATSRVLYDTLPLNNQTTLRFFTGCNSRSFPDTNLPAGNKLQAGETFVCQRIYFCGLVKSATDTSNIIEALSVLNTHFYFGEWTMNFDTMTVIKPYPLSSQLPPFNHFGKHTTNESNRLDAEQVIPTDILFEVPLRLDTYTAIANANCRCVLEGFGTVLAPGGQF